MFYCTKDPHWTIFCAIITKKPRKMTNVTTFCEKNEKSKFWLILAYFDRKSPFGSVLTLFWLARQRSTSKPKNTEKNFFGLIFVRLRRAWGQIIEQGHTSSLKKTSIKTKCYRVVRQTNFLVPVLAPPCVGR